MVERLVAIDGEPALGISLSLALDIEPGVNQMSQRNIVFQTHVPLSTPEEALNAAVDKLMRIAERQSAKIEIIRLKRMIDDAEKSFVRSRDDMQDLLQRSQQGWDSASRRGEWSEERMPPVEKQAIANHRTSMLKYSDYVKMQRKRVEELEQVVNAVHSSPDSHPSHADS